MHAPLFPGQWERVVSWPWPSGSSILYSQVSDTSCLLPGGPTSDIAQRRARRELWQLSSERERENQMCVYRAENRALLQSIPNSYPRQLGDYVNIMSDEEGRVEWDLGVIFLCILKPLCREAQWAAEDPLSQGKSQRHVRSPSDACVERTHGNESVKERCSDSEWFRRFAWFLMLLPSLANGVMKAGDQRVIRKGPVRGCA